MKITLMILGFGLSALLMVQSFSIYMLAAAAKNAAATSAASAGVGAGFVSFIAVALLWRLPFVAGLLYLFASMVAQYGTRSGGPYSDLVIWANACTAMGVFCIGYSVHGWFQRRRAVAS